MKYFLSIVAAVAGGAYVPKFGMYAARERCRTAQCLGNTKNSLDFRAGMV